jgi:hypothetical protein
MPLAIQDASAGFAPVPLGFILSPELLVTVRYSDVHAFARVKAQVERDPHMCSAAVFVALIDGMVDFTADMLEASSNTLAALSANTFGQNAVASAVRHKRMTHALRESLKAVGSAGDKLSRIRESMLGLQRIVGFVSETAAAWLLPELKTHLKTAQQDLTSLVDFESHLSGNVSAGRHSWFYQHRAERNLQSAHDRVGSRDSSDIDRQHVRHELPQHAGVSMALGLCLRIGPDRIEYIAAHPLVQAPRMVVAPRGSLCRRAPSLRAPPLHGHAIPLLIRHANQFWPSAGDDLVGVAVEAPLRILVYGTIVFFWKACFSLAGTKARGSQCIDQVSAGNPI